MKLLKTNNAPTSNLLIVRPAGLYFLQKTIDNARTAKEIEDNNGKTIVSEGLDANYFDMINYAVFCMIQINESKQQ